MAVIVKGGAIALRDLKQMPLRARRAFMNKMRSKGKKIVKTAQSYAPVDKGNLEKSIQMQELFSKGAVVFSVGDNESGVDVSDYALYMHEGQYNLGPASLAKDGGSGKVGRKFLERAIDDEIANFDAELGAAIERALL